MKYIIDIPEGAYWIQCYSDLGKDDDFIGRMFCIEDLEPYTEPDREAIENEVWKVLEAIMNEDDLDYPSNFDNCFHENCWEDVFKKHTYRDVKAKYEKWKAEKEQKDAELQDVIALADKIGIHRLYALVKEIRGE